MNDKNIIHKIFYIIKIEGETPQSIASKIGENRQYMYDLKRRKNVSIIEIEKIVNSMGYNLEVNFIKNPELN